MFNPQTEILGENVSRYTLVLVTAKRARQLEEGSPSRIETDSLNPISVALEEIAEKKVDFVE